MKLAYISDIDFVGKMSEDFYELRADISWIKTLDLYHFSFEYIVNNIEMLEEYDFVILNFPKEQDGYLLSYIPFIFSMLKKPKKGLIQHGGYDLFTGWRMEVQEAFINILKQSDFFITTNQQDKNHFRLLTDTPIIYLPTDLDDVAVQKFDTKNREEKVILSGNMVPWYGGTFSLLIAKKLKVPITIPNMGRKHSDEKIFVPKIVNTSLTFLPYLPWVEWFKILSEHKYAVNMMPIAACGSFSVACAALGIPCIGRKHITAQEICFPELCVDETYEGIDEKIKLIKTDYDRLSKYARKQFLEHFERQAVKKYFYKQLEEIQK